MDVSEHWQGSPQWGMTADQIVAVSDGAVRKIEGEEQLDHSGSGFTTLALGEYTNGPFEFDVSFRAEPGGSKLKTVRLELRDPDQYESLRQTLSAKFGEAKIVPPDPDGAIERIRWQTPTDTILLQRLTWPMDLGIDVVIDFELPAPMSPAMKRSRSAGVAPGMPTAG